jgi:hypothetical protein
MKSQITQNEEIILKHPSELHNGINTISGVFYLTNKRIIFEAHNLKEKNGIIIIHFNDILSLHKSWSKFLGVIPFSYDSITINLKLGNHYSFVLMQRDHIYNKTCIYIKNKSQTSILS